MPVLRRKFLARKIRVVKMKNIDVEKIKKDFPILSRMVNGKKLVYLDNAATTQKPSSVIGALNEYYTMHNANIHRGIHKLSEEASVLYDEAHE